MLQADLASALARQKALEDTVKDQRENHADEIKAQRQKHADALGAFESQLHTLLAQRDLDAQKAKDEGEASAKIHEMEQAFAKQMQALTAASDKAVAAARSRADNLKKECDTFRSEVEKLRSKHTDALAKERLSAGAKLKKYEDELKQATAKNSKLESVRKKLESRVRVLEQNVAAANAVSTDLKRKVKVSTLSNVVDASVLTNMLFADF